MDNHPVATDAAAAGQANQNRNHAELPLKMVLPEEFFDRLIAKYGDGFPSASGDAAGHWETVKLKVPEAAAKMRQAANDLPAAETAAAIASRLAKVSYPKFDLAQAWYSLLAFHEHTADAGGNWPGYFTRWDMDWNNIAHYSAATGTVGHWKTFWQPVSFDRAGRFPAPCRGSGRGQGDGGPSYAAHRASA